MKWLSKLFKSNEEIKDNECEEIISSTDTEPLEKEVVLSDELYSAIELEFILLVSNMIKNRCDNYYMGQLIHADKYYYLDKDECRAGSKYLSDKFNINIGYRIGFLVFPNNFAGGNRNAISIKLNFDNIDGITSLYDKMISYPNLSPSDRINLKVAYVSYMDEYMNEKLYQEFIKSNQSELLEILNMVEDDIMTKLDDPDVNANKCVSIITHPLFDTRDKHRIDMIKRFYIKHKFIVLDDIDKYDFNRLGFKVMQLDEYPGCLVKDNAKILPANL